MEAFELPEDLTKLTSDELDALEAAGKELFAAIKARSPEVLGEMTQQEALDFATSVVEKIEAVRAEKAERIDADTAFEAAVSELDERAGTAEAVAEGDEGEATEVEAGAEGEAEGEGAEVDAAATAEAEAAAEAEATEGEATEGEGETAEVEPVAVTASETEPEVKPVRFNRPAGARVKPTPAEGVVGDGRSALVASADAANLGVRMGTELGDVEAAGAIFNKQLLREHGVGVADGREVKNYLAQAVTEWPEELTLGNAPGDMEKIKAQTDPRSEALVASGGICQPLQPFFDFECDGSSARPLRDSFTQFNVTRGGITFRPPIPIAGTPNSPQSTPGGPPDPGDNIGIITDDLAAPTKSCQQFDCQAPTSVEVDIIYRCSQFGNLQDRFDPELVAHALDRTLIAQARFADSELLNKLSALATVTTAAQFGGANLTLPAQLVLAATAMRSRQRNPDGRLRVWLPSWVDEVLAVDSWRTQTKVYPGLDALVSPFGVSISRYLDEDYANPGSAIFGAQAGGGAALNPWFNAVTWHIAFEGEVIFLDGGGLDLGTVRDSTLNNTNDFQLFAETFEGLAFLGCELLEVTSTVCPSGQSIAGTEAQEAIPPCPVQ